MMYLPQAAMKILHIYLAINIAPTTYSKEKSIFLYIYLQDNSPAKKV